MTIEELRTLYIQETGWDLEQTPFYGGHILSLIDEEYIKWLEQKLTQPCPECEKYKKAYLDLEKDFIEMEGKEFECDKYKQIIEKLIKRVCNPLCPVSNSCSHDISYPDILEQCEECWKEWAYKEDEK